MARSRDMKKKIKFLTVEEKRALALQGKEVPICIGDSTSKNSYIAKIRGTIFDGSLKYKKFHM